jgi:D-glycero-alpha-D-manno-heptose-7-phosphate kinase
MTDYPNSKVTRVPVKQCVRDELESRLSLIFLGRPHYSTTIHSDVINGLAGAANADARLEPFRREAVAGRDALLSGDLAAFGRAMIRNTEAQANLHPSLVSATANKIFDIAKRHGAIGWKVNGAGGDGGSVTLLSNGDKRMQTEMLDEIATLGSGFREIGIRLDDFGIRIAHV